MYELQTHNTRYCMRFKAKVYCEICTSNDDWLWSGYNHDGKLVYRCITCMKFTFQSQFHPQRTDWAGPR